MKSRASAISQTGLLILATALSGCSGVDAEFASLQAFVEEVESSPGEPIEPIPEMRNFPAFHYTAEALRSPFEQPSIQRTLVGELIPDLDRPKETLEFYPLDNLRMAGTLSRDDKLWAIVEATNDKSVHMVQSGNFMGQNFGQVSKISAEELEILEIVPGGDGEWIERSVVLGISEKE